jgi:hypothetical protein
VRPASGGGGGTTWGAARSAARWFGVLGGVAVRHALAASATDVNATARTRRDDIR